mmetsp:Transcript_32082/g.59725  ORF Transcript_32082/g.59725 Transcript_32082/m.59725 type:complete len:222 (-) Transcript_32082:441-1106(-)
MEKPSRMHSRATLRGVRKASSRTLANSMAAFLCPKRPSRTFHLRCRYSSAIISMTAPSITSFSSDEITLQHLLGSDGSPKLATSFLKSSKLLCLFFRAFAIDGPNSRQSKMMLLTHSLSSFLRCQTARCIICPTVVYISLCFDFVLESFPSCCGVGHMLPSGPLLKRPLLLTSWKKLVIKSLVNPEKSLPLSSLNFTSNGCRRYSLKYFCWENFRTASSTS